MADVAAPPPTTGLRWFQGVPKYAWLVLGVAVMGWLLDCMDQNIFNLVRQPSTVELLRGHVSGNLDAAAKEVGAQITAVFLIGWAVGGLTFGILGDKIGRTRTMVITILIYAIFTGLSGLVQTPFQYAVCRFLTALGVGGEFAAGASLVAEVWPERSRAMALGTLQSLSAVGNMMAAIVTLVLSSVSWRWAYAVGALPAILVIWIRASVREPARWQHAKEEATGDAAHKEMGRIADLATDTTLRRNTIAGVLLALAGVGGAWGVAFFLTDLVGSAFKPLVQQSSDILALAPADQAAAVKSQLQVFRSQVFFVQQIGAFIGMLGYAAVSEKIGRRPAMFIVFVMAFLAVEGAFWGIHTPTQAYLWAFAIGLFAFAPFGAFCVYFPELYPTRLRATGVGFCYNCARILAAAAPFALGSLSRIYASPTDETAGLRTAAGIVAFVYAFGLIGLIFAPETRGKPLPE